MAILCLSNVLPSFNHWIENLHKIDPTLDIRTVDNADNLSEITSVLAWKPDDRYFKKLPNLRFIQSTGMGVDHIIECSNIRDDVMISRIIDHDMQEQMAEYALYGALKAYRNIQYYNANQSKTLWQPKKRQFKKNITVGILGLGELGLYVAKSLQQYGFKTIGWKNSPTPRGDISFYFGNDQLSEFLQQCQVLICLLPLTAATKHIVNKETLAMLPKGAYLINLARGGHINEHDLLSAIQSNHLSSALLDVFAVEPLAENHPFWQEPAIEITPHIAAMTNPITASRQVAENFKLIREGKIPNNLVDLKRGY